MTYCILSQTVEDLHIVLEKRDQEVHNGLYHAKKVRMSISSIGHRNILYMSSVILWLTELCEVKRFLLPISCRRRWTA